MYVFGKRSKERLQGIHFDLWRVMNEAIRASEIDFTVLEGLRTKERQQQLFDQGKSKTLNSRHITGHAVDIAPIVNGRVSWNLKYYYIMAEAVQKAAKRLKVDVVWGASWHDSLTESDLAPQELSREYAETRRAQGRSIFIDGPHFELNRHKYKDEEDDN